MGQKLVFGILGMALVVVFLGAIIIKLKSVALGIVMMIGVVMMIYDWWESLQEKE